MGHQGRLGAPIPNADSRTTEDGFTDIDLPHPQGLDKGWVAVSMAIEFTDDRSRRWRRTPDAALHIHTNNDQSKRWT